MQRTTLRQQMARRPLLAAATLLTGLLAACESTTPTPTAPAARTLTANADINYPGCNFTTCPNPPRILFVSGRAGNFEIYSMKYDGTNVVRLTFNPATDNYPSWSPDYSKIAFVSYRTGSAQIYTMNADGTNVTQLTTTGINSWPRWSPDGTMLAFHRTFDQKRYQIYLMKADGSQQTLWRSTPLSVSEGNPTWAPDGKSIAFTSNIQNDISGAVDIYSMKLGTATTNRITYTNRATDPAYSPDGTQIAFVTDDYGTVPRGIYVTSAAGGGTVKLVTTSKGIDTYPSWRADGKRIAFMTTRLWGGMTGAHWSIATINVDGTFLSIPSGSMFVDDYNPSWSSD
jgi:TolB protein